MPRPILLAHYMPWFEADPKRKFWGWHWRMNAFDPEKVEGGKRQIASHYYPLAGPYDSGDPAVVEWHLKLMRAAGIDGVIVDWYGLSDLYDYPILHRNTQKLIPIADRLGMKVGICYEDFTVTALEKAGKLSGARIEHVRRELDWLAANWFTRKSYLRWKGKPVLLSFGYGGLRDDEWEAALAPYKGAIVYLSEHRKRPCADGAFDWPIPEKGLAQVDAFEAARKGWPMSMPVAFPRFDDCYAEGKAQSGYAKIADARGKTLETTLRRALSSGAPFVQIATWNDWGEGTGIEPTREMGYRDLEIVQRLRRPGTPAAAVRLATPGAKMGVR